MAKQFNSIKKNLGLLDLIPIGKYKGCRVDSIIETDDDYLRFMIQKKILAVDKSVMDAINLKYSLEATAVNAENDKYYSSDNPWYSDDIDDDIPF